MRRFVIALAAAAFAFFVFAADADSEKKALIRDLMKVIDAEGLLRKAIEAKAVPKLPPDMSEEDRKRFTERYERSPEHRALKEIDYPKYTEAVFGPMFERFTVSELKDAIAWYKTPAGQKSIQMMSVMSDLTDRALDVMRPDLMAAMERIEEEEKAKVEPWKRTLADLRTLATATEAYATDTNKYPDARSMDALDAILSPTYVRTTPRKDGWGYDYIYLYSADQQHYRFASPGSDGVFSYDTKTVPVTEQELKQQRHANSDLKDDIVYQDGSFIRWPKEAPEMDSQ